MSGYIFFTTKTPCNGVFDGTQYHKNSDEPRSGDSSPYLGERQPRVCARGRRQAITETQNPGSYTQKHGAPLEVIAKLFLRIKSRPDSVTFCVKIFPLL